MLTSPDGLNWSAAPSAAFLDATGAAIAVGDIGGVVLGDGTLRLYSDLDFANFASFSRFNGQPPAEGADYEFLWWNAPAGSESGWGINLAHQGNVIFATWFTYNFAGTGTLYRTTGPAFNAVPFYPSIVQRIPVGTATFSFTDGNNGRFAYQVNDPYGAIVATQTKAITREVFLSPGTVCQ